MFEIKEVKERADFNPLVISKTAPFTEAWFFGEWQEMIGRKVKRFAIIKNGNIVGFFQMIKYPMPFFQNILYIPHGPVLLDPPIGGEGGVPFSDFLKGFKKKLIEIGKGENVIFVRFDFYSRNPNYGSKPPHQNFWCWGKENLDKYFKKVPGYAYHSSYFQPRFEWIIDLSKTEEELLNQMRPKTRYNINLALKKGVKTEISENFGKYFNDFFKLLLKTAERDNFNLHPKNYYENIFKTLDANNAFLSVASYEGKILAINLILFFGDTAYFIYGGSSDEHKNLMASHSVHWKGIVESKNKGFKFYNFGAINSENFSAQGGPASGWEGISRFKKGFGGKILEYYDSYDLVFKPFWYFLYNFRKKLMTIF